MNQNYKNLATVYDEVMGDEYVDIYHELLEKIQHSKEINGKSILDLGCGTGSLLRTFSNQNKTTGVDNSTQMIDVARKKDTLSEYVLADITDFKFDTIFDYVFCAFDTINHLPTLDEWDKVFTLAAAHLKKDGIFLFDFNTLNKFEAIHNKSLVKEIDSGLFILMTTSIDGKSTWKVHLFIKKSNGLYKHCSEEIKESSYPQEEIIEKLEKHFDKVEIVKITESGGRIFIAAKK